MKLLHPFRLAVYAGIVYALLRIGLGFRWWFDGHNMWDASFRPFPVKDFWSLLGPLFIGNRNMAIGIPLLVCIILKRYDIAGVFLLAGILIDLPDAIQLSIAMALGFSTPEMIFFMIGAYLLVPVLFLSGRYLLKHPHPPSSPPS